MAHDKLKITLIEAYNAVCPHCERYKSTIDYIFLPNCLYHNIVSCITFERDIENTSDHVPVKLQIEFSTDWHINTINDTNSYSGSKLKVNWSKFSQEEIERNYTTPISADLENMTSVESDNYTDYTENLTKILLQHSHPLVKSIRKTKNNKKVYLKLPDDVKVARSQGKAAFNSWKQLEFPSEGIAHDTCHVKRKEYRQKLRNFLEQREADKIRKLHNAANSNEKLFWKLLKGKRYSSQMGAFLVNDNLLTDKNYIREMWADHFQALGTPSENAHFDNGFLDTVARGVQEILTSCTNDCTGALSQPLEYEEVAHICTNLKAGVSGVSIDYEHIRFAGPPLWKHLFQSYKKFFENCSVCESLKTGVILPLFKGKGAKANNKDNYKGITLFPTLCKIYEMVLLNRLKNYASQKGLFSDMQFGFKEGVGCTEASFTILDTINHMLERGSKVFGCFLDVRKAFDTVWIEGLLYKLFSEFGIGGRMWLVIKDLYTGVRARVLYYGSLSREFDVLQGTGQGRILAPFMYKVYINGLLNVLTNYCYSISVNRLSLPSPSFADDVTLLALYPTFLHTFMEMCYEYSIKWRYEFNHIKSGVVTFGECKLAHYENMNESKWLLGDESVDELYEYKNLGVVKNYTGSFSSNVQDNIDKTRKKAGMIFSANFDRRKVNPLIYVKFWWQACLPILLYGSELFTLTPSLLEKLERCQLRFIRNIFYVPKFTPKQLLLKLSGLNSTESEIAIKKMLFLG